MVGLARKQANNSAVLAAAAGEYGSDLRRGMNEEFISILDRRTMTDCPHDRRLGVALQFGGTQGPIRGGHSQVATCHETKHLIAIGRTIEVEFTKVIRFSNSQ